MAPAGMIMLKNEQGQSWLVSQAQLQAQAQAQAQAQQQAIRLQMIRVCPLD